MRASELVVLLQARYCAPEWAFFQQVHNGTGYKQRRSADGIAMNLWPSRGLEVHGFEVKISRSDWKRELKEPAKAEEIAGYCDRWWLVVSDPKIVQPGELPPTWGLLAPSGKGLTAITEAPKLESKPLDRDFIAALLRRAHESLPLHEAMEKVRAEERAKALISEQGFIQQTERLGKTIQEFEEKSGVHIAEYNAGKIGEAVRIVMHGGLVGEMKRLRHARNQVRDLLTNMDSTLQEAGINPDEDEWADLNQKAKVSGT